MPRRFNRDSACAFRNKSAPRHTINEAAENCSLFYFALAAAHQDDRVALVIAEKLEAFHHPRIEAVARMLRDLARDVDAIFKPREFGARRRRKDRDLAIFALVSVLHRRALRKKSIEPRRGRRGSMRVMRLRRYVVL
jgi:hypothetical protein